MHATFTFAAVAAMLWFGAALGELELSLVQIVHRHGARSAIVPANESVICPRDCGMLNIEGKEMMTNVGSYLRGRYNGSTPSVSSANYFSESYNNVDGTSYDPRMVYSRSTAISRTLQSAAAVLRGLFPNESEYFPAIHTVEFLTDELLLIDVCPSFHVYQVLNQTVNEERIAVIMRQMFSSDLVRNMSVEMQLEGFCDEAKNYVTCILALQDVAATRNAEGLLPNFPFTYAMYDNLNDLRRLWNSYLYPYDASNPLDSARGSLGQALMQRMLSNMKQQMATTLGKRMMHYSAHDTTVMPWCATLGNNEDMLPLFGQTYILELVKNMTDLSYWVRAAQAVPGQRPVTGHVVMESPLRLRCMAADLSVTILDSLGSMCPFDDFERFINSTLPQSPMGLCYVDSATMAAMKCDEVSVAPDPNGLCYFYRTHCPAFGCPAGSVVNSTDLSCTPVGVPTHPAITDGVIAGVSLACAGVGFILALVVLKVRVSLCTSDDSNCALLVNGKYEKVGKAQ